MLIVKGEWSTFPNAVSCEFSKNIRHCRKFLRKLRWPKQGYETKALIANFSKMYQNVWMLQNSSHEPICIKSIPILLTYVNLLLEIILFPAIPEIKISRLQFIIWWKDCVSYCTGKWIENKWEKNKYISFMSHGTTIWFWLYLKASLFKHKSSYAQFRQYTFGLQLMLPEHIYLRMHAYMHKYNAQVNSEAINWKSLLDAKHRVLDKTPDSLHVCLLRCLTTPETDEKCHLKSAISVISKPLEHPLTPQSFNSQRAQ